MTSAASLTTAATHSDKHAPAADPNIGRRIGSYTIHEVLGQGGMAVVYLAQQDKPRRTVALKLIRPGVTTHDRLRRFEHEAQILGRLQHPGIAQVYEAGTADTGGGPQPYFAMERVHGLPLTRYAQMHALGTRDRLELFAKICEAVQHAHQKGVIHRDLKPGNILVTDDGQPKVLDFGVARATDADIQTTTLRTDIGQLIGTVPYMSPEQVSGDPDQLDTRSDVYALGVVLYELLAGRLPYDLHNRMIHEAVRVIREEEPTRLSSIDKTLRGDVETIVAKALEKDKDRRYQSASALATDIRHHLNDEPIAARPASAMYHLGKFAKRHTGFVGGVAAVFVVLVVGVITSTSLYVRAETQRRRAVLAEQEQNRERERAVLAEQEQNRARQEADEQRKLAEKRADETDQVAEFQSKMLSEIDAQLMGARLREDVLAEARAAMERSRRGDEEIAARLGELEALLAGTNFTNAAVRSLDRNVLQRALEAIDKQFADQPLVQARLFQTAAETLKSLGLYDAGMAPQERALQTRRNLLGDEHPDTLRSISNMGLLLRNQGKLAEAEPLLREALAGNRRVLGDDHPDTLASINNMGQLLQAQGKLAEAEPLLREALEGSRRVLGDDHPDTLASISNMGSLLHAQGKLAEAEPLLREALAGKRRVLGDDHPLTLSSIAWMGSLLQSQGKLAEAEPFFREALEGDRRVLGDDHLHTLRSINNMGALLDSQGKLAEAEPFYREALAGQRRVLGDDHPDTLTLINNMGLLLKAQGKLAEAEPLLREALEGSRRVLGDDHPDTLGSINNMGVLLHAQGKLAEAEPLYREAASGLERRLGSGHWQTGSARKGLGKVLTGLERFAEAEDQLLAAERILREAQGVPAGRYEGSVKALIELYDKWHAAEPGQGYDAKAAEWQAKLAQWQASTQPASQPATQPAATAPAAGDK